LGDGVIHDAVSPVSNRGDILFHLEGVFRGDFSVVADGKRGNWDLLPPVADASRI
jgi:hypothetical protein